jgi:hypothetical protein
VIPLVYLLVASDDETALLLGRIALIVGVQVFVVVLVCLSIALGGRGRDDPGSDDDDGRGRPRPEPPPPPSEPPVSWPDFERQFAEHVQARRARDKVPSA